MTKMRTIEIDFDIHKKIESERASFDEQPNAVLRRLLGLPVRAQAEERHFNGIRWQEEGVILPPGTKVRMIYDRGRQRYEGEIKGGKWYVAGRTFDSPSGGRE